MATPPIRWVGSKRGLVTELLKHVPWSFGVYHEPFVGGGALFFALEAAGRLKQGAMLADANWYLINTYYQLRINRGRVSEMLFSLQQERLGADTDEAFYYHCRDWLNTTPGGVGGNDVTLAALFLAINRLGFNGLWRVNKQGKCNVPVGRGAGGKLLPSLIETDYLDNLLHVGLALEPMVVSHAPFEASFSRAVAGDLLYADPPYVPVSATADFTGYTEGGFDHRAQTVLRDCALAAASRGVHVILSNADCAIVRKLYESPAFVLHEVRARRAVNSDATKRGKVGELIIVGKN